LKYGLESEEYRLFKVRKDLIDPPINLLGISQCENSNEYINEIDFHTVFVSPMLRTCMTAMHMFKKHPNKKNIKFIVLPAAKEGLHLCNDVSGPLSPIQQSFSNP
jgi:hypothetical protein